MKKTLNLPWSNGPQRILIIKPSSLGDVAATLPLLCDLRRLYPHSKIDWLIRPAFAELINGHDALDEVILFQQGHLARWWSGRGVGAAASLRRKLKANKYDMVFDAQGLLRSAFIARLTKAPVRIGFTSAREGATLFYTHGVDMRRQDKVAVVRMRSLLTLIQEPDEHVEFRVPISPATIEAVRQMFNAAGPVAAIIPGARWDAKRWSHEGFVEIGRRLQAAGVAPVVLGSPQEFELCQYVADGIGPTAVNLGGKTSLAQMIAALSLSRIAIGNDSGPLHVAVALGKPVVALYGPTDEKSVGPWNQLHHVLRFDDLGDYRATEPDRSETLKRLPADRVWRLTESLLNQPAISHIN
ncbi:MAG: glycosyltransferase family 9 protein [Phycisphaerales bacterium]|nr:glycosyltransferase family 9 protein [Phycisphaerales bacterium]